MAEWFGCRTGRTGRCAHRETYSMHWNGISGQWAQFKGRLKEQWGALTDDELEAIAGNREQLIGKLQEKHGLTKDEAERYH
jgi:uncharacterized protein YjbJ (UPF0337 family)